MAFTNRFNSCVEKVKAILRENKLDDKIEIDVNLFKNMSFANTFNFFVETMKAIDVNIFKNKIYTNKKMETKHEITHSNVAISINDKFIQIINKQKQKEENADIWKDSPYKDLVKLQLNNVGNVGETYIQNICDTCQIEAQVNGSKTKKLGGGVGDGLILNNSVEIKTSHRGSISASFQHELGETPWKSEFMIFIDVAPICIYLTIFKNFNQEFYKSGAKCDPYFPTKSITWRKGTGSFKLDTTIKINELNIIKKHTFRIDDNTDINELKTFILFILF